MKRFIFILAFALVISSCGNKKGTDPDIPSPEKSGNVSGCVTGSDGKKLSGVVVSDGTNCTVTDVDGCYALPTDVDDFRFIFVSTPKGYSAPVADGIPVFYKAKSSLTADASGKYTDVDFTLEKIQSPDRFTMTIAADPQPRASTAGYDKIGYHSLDCCNDMYKDMKEFKSTVTDGRPVYGMVLGDIVHENMSLFNNYCNGLATIGYPTYNLMGNHDHDKTKPTDEEAAEAYESHFGPSTYSFNLGDLHFVVLDNMIAPSDGNGGVLTKCEDGLTDRIWKWMQADLSYVSKDKTIMLCAHSPMFKLLSGSERTGAKHYGDYKALLSKYAKVYAWAGHVHTTYNYVDTSNPVIETHSLSRVTGPLWTNEYINDNGTPRGYIVFDYDNGSVSWKFRPIPYQSSAWSGGSKQPDYSERDWNYVNGVAQLKTDGSQLDDKYQMRWYAPGVIEDGYLYVDVFLWDELWKLPKFISNGVPTTMKRATGDVYDHCSSQLISWYKANCSLFVNNDDYTGTPTACRSMFKVFINEAHGTGTISVEDRFGNTYSSAVTW